MAKSRSGLGRDFYSLLDDNILGNDKTNAATNLRISDVEPRSDQPRKTFAHEPLEQLADSIAQFGVLQPIIVRESTLLAGTYEIIAGERRWRAAKMAGLSEIPAVILEGDDLKAAQVAVIENVQREDLNPVDLNNSIEAQLSSLFNSGSANPGNIWLYCGIAIAVVGAILLVLGLTKKNADNN